MIHLCVSIVVLSILSGFFLQRLFERLRLRHSIRLQNDDVATEMNIDAENQTYFDATALDTEYADDYKQDLDSESEQSSGNLALQDNQTKRMLLEQDNKKKLIKAKQEQEHKMCETTVWKSIK